MKNQYIGDIGDYGKYSLLRAFAKEGIRIGVNWYLTEDDNGSDGKHTKYLDHEEERLYDPELFSCLKKLVKANRRDVIAFETEGMIADAVYYNDLLDISNVHRIEAKRAERSRWHLAAMKNLQEAELVFLDPDNGLSTDDRSVRKNSVKYAFASEAADYFNRGQNIVYYCHKGRRTPAQWEDAKKILSNYIPEAILIALTFHRGTQRTFIFAIHEEDFEQYEDIIKGFMESEWKEVFEIESVNGTYRGRRTAFAGPAIGTVYPKGTTVQWNPDGTISLIPPVDGDDIKTYTRKR